MLNNWINTNELSNLAKGNGSALHVETRISLRFLYQIVHVCNAMADKNTHTDIYEKEAKCKRPIKRRKEETLNSWCENLDSTYSRRMMFAMAKQMRKDEKDITKGIRILHQGQQWLIEMQNWKIRDHWNTYFDSLLNKDNPNEIEEGLCVGEGREGSSEEN